jgi:glycopeptide antibiotics resistance protein
MRSKLDRSTSSVRAPGASEPTSPAGVDRPSAPRPPRAIHFLLLAAGFAAFAIYGSLLPFRYTPLSWAETLERFRQLPFFDLSFQSRADWLENILLFVPIGLFALAALTVDNSSRAWKAASIAIILSMCTLFSIALEFTQFWFPPRSVSQNDIAAETIGATLGAVLWLWIGPTATVWIRKVTARRRAHEPLDWVLYAYCWWLFFYSIMPLDFTIRRASLLHKYEQGRLQLVPFTNTGAWHDFLGNQLAHAAIFAPLGVLVATAFTASRHVIRPLARCVAIGLVIASGIEVCQMLVYSQSMDTTDIFSGTLGIALGAWGVRWWRAS